MKKLNVYIYLYFWIKCKNYIYYKIYEIILYEFYYMDEYKYIVIILNKIYIRLYIYLYLGIYKVFLYMNYKCRKEFGYEFICE